MVIEPEITEIKRTAFNMSRRENEYWVRKLVIPSTVKTMSNYAFADPGSEENGAQIKNLTFQDGVKLRWQDPDTSKYWPTTYLFKEAKIGILTLPDDSDVISEWWFDNAKIENFRIPDAVKFPDPTAFADAKFGTFTLRKKVYDYI
ncbi:leucine-rich repeat domain-containing protein [Mycoplasmopsis equigenitalium]|uniref:Leucine-rich repeat domain-containing protein n=1 Tax=Mycoplasmopsis equigenitalium TaxID=114883 RepID=A0ABY5J230_9BACT|nr:leucine-rich repeat domain-containing protein [Mycoplasmopsis equigenitalium]